jgi:type VI secretion system protein ImpK
VPSVKDLLAPEVKRGAVAVADDGGVTTVTLKSANQFASGGVDIDPKLASAVLAIAAALDKAPGAIVVTGHADAKPSSNPKFPSNQDLSAARGESVARLIAGKLRDPKRVKAAGAGDSQQVAPSDTAENRAKNRRVVIVLQPAP